MVLELCEVDAPTHRRLHQVTVGVCESSMKYTLTIGVQLSTVSSLLFPAAKALEKT